MGGRESNVDMADTNPCPPQTDRSFLRESCRGLVCKSHHTTVTPRCDCSKLHSFAKINASMVTGR